MRDQGRQTGVAYFPMLPAHGSMSLSKASLEDTRKKEHATENNSKKDKKLAPAPYLATFCLWIQNAGWVPRVGFLRATSL